MAGVSLIFTPLASQAADCKSTVYLTLDTGNMSQAERIAGILNAHKIKATFFLANEKTGRGDFSLDPAWGDYWRARVREGHAFGSHTWRHGYFRKDLQDARVMYVPTDGQPQILDGKGVCSELNHVNEAFEKMTGRKLDPLWRAPGGRLTPVSRRAAELCGYRHVGWADAGFLGDELPSDKYPNDTLLKKALRDIRDGDILMMHLGVWSRKEVYAPMLDPLIADLKDRGFCFARVTERKS